MPTKLRVRWCLGVIFGIIVILCVISFALVIHGNISLQKKQVFPPQPYENLPDVIRLRQLGVGIDGIGATVTVVEIYAESMVHDADMACLTNWPSLIHASLAGPQLTGAVLQYLRPCSGLKSLDLVYLRELDDKNLINLCGLENLARLEIHGGSFSDKGIECIGGLRNLVRLVVSDAPITDKALKYLEGLKELNLLGLYNIHITDAGLAYLLPMKQLRDLSLVNCDVTDIGFSELSKLTNLKNLSICGNKVTSRGLVEAVNLKHLQFLDVRDTGAKENDVQQLHQALPELSILGDGWKVGEKKGISESAGQRKKGDK